MNDARSYPSVAVLNEKIYVAGGMGSFNELLWCFEVFDPKTDEWIDLPNMRFSLRELTMLPILDNNRLYAIEMAVERYDPLTNRWTNVRTRNTQLKRFAT